MLITLDLETIGTEDAAVIAEIAAGITHPKTMSKPETIAKWEADDKPILVEEAIKKTSFDGGVGRIVCIGWSIGNNDPLCVYEGPESVLIEQFFDCAREAVSPPTFIGHNISGFDLRFLWQRAVVNKIKPPANIPFHAKPWDKGIADTMTMWNPDREKRTSLDRLCRLLGIDSPKTELDGSKVLEYVKAGRIKEVAEYCKGDVTAIRECYRRMTFL